LAQTRREYFEAAVLRITPLVESNAGAVLSRQVGPVAAADPNIAFTAKADFMTS